MNVIVFIFLGHTFIPAGRLIFNDMGKESYSDFAYGRQYLKRPEAVAIDPIGLPLKSTPFRTKQNFPVFSAIRDAGPDRWGRDLLEKRFGRSLNEMEYILGVGPHRVGALAFGPDTSRPMTLTPEGFAASSTLYFDLSLCLKATEDALADLNSEELKLFLQYGASMGGARPKAAVYWKEKPCLAKFSTSLDTRNEPALEFATMKLAQRVLLNVPDIELIKVSNRDVYIIDRFDRRIVNGQELLLPFLSGLSVTELHEADYSARSYAGLVQAITKRSSDVARDKNELYRRMIFNILVNNDDDHLRNHGFVSDGKGTWKLAPLYDVVPRDQMTNTFRLALAVGDFGKEASKRNALSAAPIFDISTDSAEAIWDELENIVIENWQNEFDNAGLSSGTIDRFRHSFGSK